MEWIILLAVVLVVLALFVQKLNTTSSDRGSTAYRYRRRKTLFSAAERSLLGVLDSVIDPQQHRIFGKVRVADLIEPEPNRNRGQWKSAFNRINAKHFDFVICQSADLTPVCAIELDDASHKQSKRQQRDELLETICQQAGLPLVRIPAKRGYQKADIEKLIKPILVGIEKIVIPKDETGIYIGDDIGAASR